MAIQRNLLFKSGRTGDAPRQDATGDEKSGRVHFTDAVEFGAPASTGCGATSVSAGISGTTGLDGVLITVIGPPERVATTSHNAARLAATSGGGHGLNFWSHYASVISGCTADKKQAQK